MLQFALAPQRHRDRELGEAVQKIGGAVQGVYDPLAFAVPLRAAFLSQNGMARVGLAYGADDDLFRAPINLGDEIVAAFLRRLDVLRLVQSNGRLNRLPRGRRERLC